MTKDVTVQRRQGSRVTIKDKALLEYASQGKSPVEIATLTGTPAEDVYARIRELLKQRDVWDELERRKLMLYSAYDLKAKIDGWLTDGKDFGTREVDAYLKTLKMIGEILDSQQKITDSELTAVTEEHTRYMMRLIEQGFDAVIRHLEAEHPEVDLVGVQDVFVRGIARA